MQKQIILTEEEVLFLLANAKSASPLIYEEQKQKTREIEQRLIDAPGDVKYIPLNKDEIAHFKRLLPGWKQKTMECIQDGPFLLDLATHLIKTVNDPTDPDFEKAHAAYNRTKDALSPESIAAQTSIIIKIQEL